VGVTREARRTFIKATRRDAASVTTEPSYLKSGRSPPVNIGPITPVHEHRTGATRPSVRERHSAPKLDSSSAEGIVGNQASGGLGS